MSNTLNLGTGNWATKEDSLLGYNSENGNFKPLPFDFTRASSATVINKEGLIETVGSGEPRIDFKDNTKGSLLLEPTRSNLITYSEDFSEWIPTAIVLTENIVTSPNGTITADKIAASSVTAQHRVNFTSSNVSGATTFSFFAKAAEYNSCWSRIGASNYFFDLENKLSYPQSQTSIEDYGDGWYRCIMTNPISNANEVCRINITTSYLDTSDFLGDNTSGIYLYGAQLEQGSYATSYIPTSGQSGGVTRVADNAYQQNVTQVIGQSEGTMFIEFTPKDSSTLQILYQAKSSSGVVGQVDIRLQGGLIRALANDGGGSQFFMNGGSYTVGTKYKVAVRYKLNDSKLYINGTDTASDTTCSFIGSSLDQVSFADSLSSFLPSVDIVDSRLYNTALTDAELQALTKI